ncbi:hypothetical protein D3C71_1383480 [compost metagenome]
MGILKFEVALSLRVNRPRKLNQRRHEDAECPEQADHRVLAPEVVELSRYTDVGRQLRRQPVIIDEREYDGQQTGTDRYRILPCPFEMLHVKSPPWPAACGKPRFASPAFFQNMPASHLPFLS